MRTHLPSGCVIFLLLLAFTQAAAARTMHVMNSMPAAEAVIQGGHAQYVVRFDGPVDHAQARLEILQNGQVVERLRPLLDSAPEVLFASAPALQAGRYVLHWSVKSMPDGDDSDGMIPFSVAP
jgi:methionine-rich copper-binding protein CopC